MKKLLQISAVLFGMLMAQSAYADMANYSSVPSPQMSGYHGSMSGDQGYSQGRQFFGKAPNWSASQGESFAGGGCGVGGCGPAGCPAPSAPMTQAAAPQSPCDEPTGECYCMYVRHEPCYYQVPRCVEEQIPCKKKCWRYVPKYYEVERCRYVPQYYKETYCRQEPECYYVDDCKTCKKIVYDQKCQYVPKYYWKHTCGNTAQAPVSSGSCCQ